MRTVGAARRLGLLVSVVVAAAGFAQQGCADPANDRAVSSADAYTVENGHKFVVRTSENEVVLRKQADGRAFPFTAPKLTGKAILIHPVAGKSDGVYGRVLSVDDKSNDLVLATEPLSIDEMEKLTEDDVVRIYLDPAMNNSAPKSEDPKQATAGAVNTQSWGGLFGGDLTAMGEIEFLPGTKFENNITVTYDGGHLSLRPELLANYSRETGLEVGMRGSFSWSSAISIEGDTNVRTKIFRTPRVGPPGIWVTVPIGIFPVPVRLRLVGFLECEAMGKTQFDAKLTMSLNAHVGGSIRVKPTDGPLKTWVSEGPWPFDVGGGASAKLDGNIYPGAGSGVECTLPRIELETLIAGVAGPYLAIAPEFRRVKAPVGPAINSMNVTLKLGMRGRLFGREANSELDLYGWTPGDD